MQSKAHFQASNLDPPNVCVARAPTSSSGVLSRAGAHLQTTATAATELQSVYWQLHSSTGDCEKRSHSPGNPWTRASERAPRL